MERRFRTQEPAFAYQTPESALAPASMYNETPVFTFTPAPVQQTPERMLYFGVCFPNAGPQCQLRRYESKRRSSLLLQRRTLRRWSCLRLRRRTKHDAIVARGSGVILARHRGELQQALLTACGGVWRPYSSLQYRSSALVAVVACWSFALSIPIPPINTGQRGADGVVSGGLDASRESFSKRS